MTDTDPTTVDSDSVTILGAIRATLIDWILNTPPGGLYTGLAVLLVVGAGFGALWVLGPVAFLDKYGADFRSWALAVVGALLAFKGVGKVVVHLTEKAKAKAASTLAVQATAPAGFVATASVQPQDAAKETTP